MAKKGDEVWVFRIQYGRFYIGKHRVVSLGAQLAGLDGSGPETRYSSRVAVDSIHPTKKHALEAALMVANDGVDAAREELAKAEALRSGVADLVAHES